MKNKLYPPQRKRKAGKIAIAPPIVLAPNGFTFANGVVNNSQASWGDWLMSQPAPAAKPKHKLDYLSSYLWGQSQEYNLALDLFDRWGYALNVGYSVDYLNNIADAKLAIPTTSNGKLLKLAINNPVKYPVAMEVVQTWYSDEKLATERRVLKDAYLQDASGIVIGGWSPEATPAAMAISIAYKCDVLHAYAATGINIVQIYDGGETGLQAALGGTTNPDTNFGRDPKVVAAKGASDWTDYLSRKKGEQMKLLYDGIKAAVPNRNTYVMYGGAGGNAHPNIPGARDYSFNGIDMIDKDDAPTGIVYFRDFGVSAAGMGNPTIMDRSYTDTLSRQLSAIAENITRFGKPLSYNWCSAGSFRDNPNPISYYYCPIAAYKGFLKCLYAIGQKGGVAGYFTDDVDSRTPKYPAYNPVNPPHWLLQEMALGEVHNRFSWFDEFIVNGDLLPGINNGKINTAYPPFELTANNVISGFYIPIQTVRCFVRKLRGQDKWLVVLWVAESGTDLTTVATGADKLVWVADIPGVEPIQFNACGNGSIYTIDRTSGITIVKREDPPAPNALDTPTVIFTNINPLATQIVLKVYSIKGINHNQVPLASSFTVTGATVNIVTLTPCYAAQTYITLNITNNTLVPGSAVTIAYNGSTITDYETNALPAFSNSTTLFASLFQNLNYRIYSGNNSYTTDDEAAWFVQTMSSTQKAVGDCTIEADLYNNAMLSLSPESTNIGDYRTWLYTCNSGTSLAAYTVGSLVVTGTYNGSYATFTSGDRVQLKRVGGVVTLSKKAVADVGFTLLATYPTSATTAMYAHAAFNGNGGKIANVITTGFA